MQTVTQQFFIFKFCVIFLINLMQKESLKKIISWQWQFIVTYCG